MKTHTIPNEDLKVFEFDLTKNFDFVKLATEAKNYCDENSIKFATGVVNPKTIDYGLHLKTSIFNNLISAIEDKTSLIIQSSFPNADIKVIPKVEESWIIIYNKLNYAEAHTHHMWAYSAVCYLKAENASSIMFNKTEIIPSVGKLLIFPGFLTHSVRPVSFKNGARIAFVCNLYHTSERVIR